MFDFLMGYVMGERSATRAAAFARSAGGGAGARAGEFHDVNERVDRLILVVDAMWSLLKDSGWTDEQLRDRLRELDVIDGVEDGRRTARPSPCGGCGSMVEVGRSSCAFCGVAIAAKGPVTDGI
ncbi:MAG: hypothetical protein ACFCVC_04935 [Acidimicrobiia bacterium]